MAVREFKLPDVGEGVAEGELVSWLVAPGDAVSEDQPVAEVETDKALVEVPSPFDGAVAELRAEEGEVIPVGEVFITFEVDEEAAPPSAEDEPEAEPQPVEGGSDGEGEAAAESEAADTRAPESASAGEEPGPAEGDGEAAAVEGDAGAPPGEQATAETEQAEPSRGRVFAPPSVRRLARELGVDIGAIEGTGPGGRVTEADVRGTADSEAAGGGAEGAETGEATAETAGSAESAATEPAAEESAAAGTGATPEGAEPAGRERTLAAPATRRVAEEAGVDLNDVPAVETRDGEAYVTSEAVREYAAAQRAAREAETGAAGSGAEAEAATSAGIGPARTADEATVAEATTEAAGAAGTEATGAKADVETGAVAGERVPYRGVRRTIGEQMVRSAFTAPHVTHHDRMDASALAALREEYRAVAAERDVKLTYMPFVMKAVVSALKEFPYMNATLDEDAEEIVLREEYNLGVAVATDAGLMVPVIREVDRKGILQIARETNELVGKARDRSISRSEMQGSTFTITNFGAIGGEYATPIINHPEVAILGLGAIEERPWVVSGTPEESRDGSGGTASGEVTARKTLPLSLSIDHRVVDGAVAAEFTNRVMESLSKPKLLLLE